MTASLLNPTSTDSTTPITVYSQPGCPGCTATKRALDKSGAEYQVIDISEKPEARAQVLELGYSALPVVVYGEDNWSGFRPDRIKASVQSQQVSKAA